MSATAGALGTRAQPVNPVAVQVTFYLGRGLLLFAVVRGALTIAGGDRRWSSPAYEYALRVPWAPQSWGVALLAFGVLGWVGVLLRHQGLYRSALVLCAAWCASFGACLALVAYRNPGVGWDAITSWVAFTGGFLLAAMAALDRYQE